MRVVSLLASATEIVCALDAGDTLVGRSHECDNPEWVSRLPRCSEPAFDVLGPSRAIDAEVRRRLRAGEPLYHVANDRIRALRPDLVIAQTHCEVCAVTPAAVERDPSCLTEFRLVGMSAFSLDDISASIAAVADALGRSAQGQDVIARERARLDAVHRAFAPLPRPTVALIEWTDPMFVMGNWMPELVRVAGGEPVLGHPGELSRGESVSQLVEADPEFVIVAPCGFPLERALAERPVLEAYPGWRDLRAVRAGHVAIADGNRYFNRSGMTVGRTAEIIAQILHGVGGAGPAEEWRWL